MAKRYSREVKEEVLGKVRSGQRVAEVAQAHGIHEVTVRSWLERDTTEGASQILEMSRLRRENESLLRIIGQLTFESELQKKISAVAIVERGAKTRLALELGVCRASLYYRRKMPGKDEELRRQMEAVMLANPGYGSPRVALALRINKKRVSRVMKKFHLKPARRAKMPRKPMDEGREPSTHLNILSRLSPIAPNVVWASDFTFILFDGRFIYLCTVIDIFTGEVLGCNISLYHDATFVKLAIKRAIAKCQTLPSWFHSDQGSEYASVEVEGWLQSLGVTISMNPKGSPWCNGSQESFYGRFKVEFGDVDRFETLAELLEELYKQLYYHSNVRIKTKLKMAPARFRKQWYEKHQLPVIHSHPQVVSLPPDPPQGTGTTTNLCIMSV